MYTAEHSDWGAMYSSTTKSCFVPFAAMVSGFHEAYAICARGSPPGSGLRSRLAQIRTRDAYLFLKNNFQGYYWIGLKTPNSGSTNIRDWMWYDNETTPTSCLSTSYQPPVLRLTSGDGDCVGLIATGGLDSLPGQQPARMGNTRCSWDQNYSYRFFCEYLAGILK